MTRNGSPHKSREAFFMNSGTSTQALKAGMRRGVDPQCELAIEYVSPHDVKLDPSNPRIHRPKQIRQLMQSIKTFGFIVPAQVDSEGKVVAGHGRVVSARELKLPFIPIIRLGHLTREQLRAYAIADNKLTENAEWDLY
jgi:ParB-like chromosome segregation protein Spo0J